MNSIRQQIKDYFKTGLSVMTIANGYTREVNVVTNSHLMLSDNKDFYSTKANVDYEIGADVTEDKSTESQLKTTLSVLIKTFIECKADVSNASLIPNEAEEWLANWDAFFYGHKNINPAYRCKLRNIPGVTKHTIYLRDPIYTRNVNRVTVAILLRIYFNQSKLF